MICIQIKDYILEKVGVISIVIGISSLAIIVGSFSYLKRYGKLSIILTKLILDKGLRLTSGNTLQL